MLEHLKPLADLAGLVSLGALTAVGAAVKYNKRKAQAAVEECVPRSEFTATVNSLRHEIREGNGETHRRLDQVLLHIAKGEK